MKKISDEEWEKMFKEGLSNEDLKYLMRWTSKKEEAKQILDSRPKKTIDIIKMR